MNGKCCDSIISSRTSLSGASLAFVGRLFVAFDRKRAAEATILSAREKRSSSSYGSRGMLLRPPLAHIGFFVSSQNARRFVIHSGIRRVRRPNGSRRHDMCAWRVCRERWGLANTPAPDCSAAVSPSASPSASWSESVSSAAPSSDRVRWRASSKVDLGGNSSIVNLSGGGTLHTRALERGAIYVPARGFGARAPG